MLPGPVFNAELMTTARRPRYYLVRFIYGAILLFFVWRTDPAFSPWMYPSYLSGMDLADMARLGQRLFTTFLFVQSFAVLFLTPALVAGVIADEKQRKTLHYLLASPLTSGEIVLGKLAARMLHLAVFLAIGVPVMSLVSLFGGVEPALIAVAFVATATTAFFLSAGAMLISVHARRPREAISLVYLVEIAWLFLPSMITFLMPLGGPTWVWIYGWIRPVNEWLNATSPFHVLVSLGPTAMLSVRPLLRNVGWMIVLQAGYGALFLVIALLRLRAVARREGEGAQGVVATGRLNRRARILPRPPCGDDAMAWKERYVSRTSVATKAVTALVVLATVCVLGEITYETFARPAFVELATYGYGASGSNRARDDFNGYLRGLGTIIYVLWAVGVASAASAGLTSEREEDTWTSLISTPLSGAEIIRAKMFGAVWGLRWVGWLLLGLWITGLAAGSIHPFGFAAVLIETAVFLWFVAALGTYISLHASTSAKALLTTMAILFVLNGAYLMCCIPFRPSESFLWAGITPMIEVYSLASYEDVRLLFTGHAPGTLSRSSGGEVVLTCFVGVLGYVAAAGILSQRAIDRFDQAIDRPKRQGEVAPPEIVVLDDEFGENDPSVSHKKS